MQWWMVLWKRYRQWVMLQLQPLLLPKPSIVVQERDWTLRPNHFPIVAHFVVARAEHAIDGVQNVATDVAQIERCAWLYFEQLSGIPFYPNNETEIPCERSFAGPMDHGPVHAIERMYDAQPHTSTNVCTLFRCTICWVIAIEISDFQCGKSENDQKWGIRTEIRRGALASCLHRRLQPPPVLISSSWNRVCWFYARGIDQSFRFSRCVRWVDSALVWFQTLRYQLVSGQANNHNRLFPAIECACGNGVNSKIEKKNHK